MASLGPVVVIAEQSAADLIAALGKAGAFPVVEVQWTNAPNAIGEIGPSALVLAEAEPVPAAHLVKALVKQIESADGAIMPVMARVSRTSIPAIPSALPVAIEEPFERLVARLISALRVRTLHATVLRRSEGADKLAHTWIVPPGDLLDTATVLCVGRGRSYPALTTRIGERVGLIGALSIETAARYLKTRDIDGIVIGDGFGPRVVEALITVLAEDARFRDLPVGLLGHSAIEGAHLPNLIRGESNVELLVERLLPMVRLQAFEGHLKRVLKSLDTDGVTDPETGLLARTAFWRDLDRAVHEAGDGGGALSVARFTFEEEIDRRASIDAARLFSRLVRDVDFAYREVDGSILAAFTETDLRSANVVARRIASVLKQTMLLADRDQHVIRPTITLATLKPSDNLSTLVARVGTYPQVATG